VQLIAWRDSIVSDMSYSVTIGTLSSTLCKCRTSNPEEVLGGSGVDGSVLNGGLFGEVVGGVYRREHALDGEEGGEVGCVG